MDAYGYEYDSVMKEMHSAYDHIYVHVPFCDGKCSYCAFYSVPYTPQAADSYLAALEREMDARLPRDRRAAPLTIYFGGGTPSILSPDRLARLCGLVTARVSLARLCEWTVEANPGTLANADLRQLAAAGINRISLGAQSFDDAVLRDMGRRHGADDIGDTLRRVRAAGIANAGLDLIAGYPGVTRETWQATLRGALELEPAHLSVYALGIEPGTRLRARRREGEAGILCEERQVSQLDIAAQAFAAAGYEHYEVSNYALQGFACAHNLSCWQGEDYLGLGPAAASRQAVVRRTNPPDLELYIRQQKPGHPPAAEERLTADQDVCERLMFAFRLQQGLDLDIFCRRWGSAACARRAGWEDSLAELIDRSLVRRQGATWTPTPRGLRLADAVASEFLP